MSNLSKLILAVAFSIIGTGALAQQQPTAEQQQLYMQMLQTSQQLQALQQQAFDTSDALAAQRDDLLAMIDTEMIEIEAASEALIAKRDELIETLQAAPPGAPSQELQAAGAEYQSTMQQLQAVQEQALQNADIQTLQAELQEAVVVVMAEIDPQADALIARFEELRDQMMQLQQ